MIYLTEKDIQMLNFSLSIMKNLNYELRELSSDEAARNVNDVEKYKGMYHRKDGKDTRVVDAVAERCISVGNGSYGHWSAFMRAYDDTPGVIITEERGKIGQSIGPATPVIITDPVDRSSHLEKIIKDHQNKCNTLGEVFDRERETVGDEVALYESCNSSVTLLYDNMIKYSVVLNLFTSQVFVAYEKGVFTADINSIDKEGQLNERVSFKADEGMTMLCYNKEGKYESNRIGTHLRFFDLYGDRPSPGGPNRFAHIMEQDASPIQVIAHNGEKLQESLPNIAVAFFSEGRLQAYKLYCDREKIEFRANRPLTPNLENSIFNQGLLINTGLKLSFLDQREYPSQFRDTSVIASSANEQAMSMLDGMVERNYAIRII